MSLATCDSLLAIKIKYKTLFKTILDTSDRLPQNRKPFSVDSEIPSIVRTDATVAKRSGAAELPLSFIPFSRDLPCYHRNPCAFPKICFCCRRCPPHTSFERSALSPVFREICSVAAIHPFQKQKSRLSCNFFAIRDSLLPS